MDGATDTVQKSGESLNRIRIEHVTGNLENPSESTGKGFIYLLFFFKGTNALSRKKRLHAKNPTCYGL